MLIGYMRPYQDDPDCENQKIKLSEAGCDLIVEEEHSSAKRRTKLKEMMGRLQPGDKVVVARLFTWADSTRHLVELLDMLSERGGFLHSLAEGIDTCRQEGYPFDKIVHYLVEFQSDVISEKTKKGLYEAKQKGSLPGRPRKPDENVRRAILMYQSKNYSLAEIKEQTGISKSTLYRYLENEST